jgi:hypothetical protein
VSFDIEKAFDRIGHAVIIQALRAFGIPERIILALINLTLTGYARVEVNGRQSILITIKTGSGQGDPLSSILFLIGSEPLNMILATKFLEIMYKTEENVTVGPILFADDNISPLSLNSAEDINPLLDIYNRYTGVSGLNINVRKSAALCVNTSPEIMLGLREKGLTTPATVKHLGIELSQTIEETVENTLNKIDLKAAKRRIMATAPPTDMLHRATLINRALTPIYNHVFMALPVQDKDVDPLYKEIQLFLWSKTVNQETVQKRRLVSRKRLSASFDKGGLEIQHPSEVAAGLRINLVQKLYKRSVTARTTLNDIIDQMLTIRGRPSVQEHIHKLGPTEWSKTGRQLMRKNLMIGTAFQDVAQLLTVLEESNDTWHLSPIRGHTKTSKLLPFTGADFANLEALRLTTISQIYETHLSGGIDKTTSTELRENLAGYPHLFAKLDYLAKQHRRKHFHGKFSSEQTNAVPFFGNETNMSRRYRILNRQILDSSISKAPSYNTRQRDGIDLPETRTFTDAYKLVSHPVLPSKTKETIFQILNRTIWTNNKAFKSGRRPDPNCDRCGDTENMEHLLYECDHYSRLLWERIGKILTRYLIWLSEDYIPRVELGFRQIIFNVPHPSILLHVKDKHTRIMLIMMVQETKRDIIYRRMNLPPSAQQVVNSQRLAAHIDQVIRRLISYLQYIGLQKFKQAIKSLHKIQEINLNLEDQNLP